MSALKTSYPFATPGYTQGFEAAGTAADATTLVDRIGVSEYLVVGDSQAAPFISTATQVSTFTQTFVAAGSSGYEIIYSPEETGGVGMIQSCSFQGQDKGECVEQDWVVGQSSTRTTTFTGPLVPYWTVTKLDVASTAVNAASTSASQTSTQGNQGNSAYSTGTPPWLMTMIFSLGVFMTM
ncbi:hypothetical protein V5O48_009561 [Marasmius crinis-equi]|uniref:Uncharacterized protein n=1 Tax=Marasmius crinis-equi TaxID=585013 RepID=A0ABR3FAV6_9AGAR